MHTAPTADAPATADDPRPALARASAIAVDLAQGVRPDQLGAPTPSGDMTVRRLLQHLHMVFERTAAVASPEVRSGGAPLPEEDDTIADDRWPAAIADAAGAARHRWSDDELLTEQLTLPWMTGTGAEVLAIYLNEALVHSWDLATATGQSVDWPDADAELSLELIRSQLPVADRTELWAMYEEQLAGLPDQWEAPFANAVDVADDAPSIDRLVAWCGRTP